VPEAIPRVVIIGGGFGGLAAAKALRKTPAQILLVDRANHHVFQPLLYQVATSELSPGNIGFPIRGLMRKQKNAAVVMAELTDVDKDQKRVVISDADRNGVPIDYDYLVLATGATHSYFGHDEFAEFAPGVKGLDDAVAIRNKILQAFEQAEGEEDPTRHKDLLTFVLVGGGPTGVELAGALADLVRTTLRSEFRRIDPTSARIVLVDRGNRVLGSFSEYLSGAAKKRLEKRGVEILLGKGVDQIDQHGVIVSGERILSKTVIWTAGVKPSPAGIWLKAETDHAGRVRINHDLTVPNHPEIFVIGDTAAMDQDGKPLPGVAQVAMQQGRYAARLIHNRISGKAPPAPFRYFDKGNMAVVGKGFAILQTGKIQLAGFIALMGWAFVHLHYLATPGLRTTVLMQWAWTYVTGQRGSRIIMNRYRVAHREPAETPKH
jgi:NADH dehydrogenase